MAAVALVAGVLVAAQAAEVLVEAAILSEVAVVREAVLVADMVTSVADRAFFTTILFNGEDSNLTVFHSRNLIHLLIEKHSLNSFIDDTMTHGETSLPVLLAYLTTLCRRAMSRPSNQVYIVQ